MSRTKRFLILFLSLITMMGLLTGCGIIPTTLVSEVDPSVYQYKSNVRHIQDLGAFFDCLTCGGDGDCNTCNGYGEWRRYNSVVSTCNTCNGSGNCRTCGGSGKR